MTSYTYKRCLASQPLHKLQRICNGKKSNNSISSAGTSDADSYAAGELSLSCSFSSFEGDNPDDAVESSHEDADSEIIEPYSFEPVAIGVDSLSDALVESESNSSRLDNMDW